MTDDRCVVQAQIELKTLNSRWEKDKQKAEEVCRHDGFDCTPLPPLFLALHTWSSLGGILLRHEHAARHLSLQRITELELEVAALQGANMTLKAT